VAPEEAIQDVVGGEIAADDVAFIVDAGRARGHRAGHVQGGDRAAAEQEAVPAAGVVVRADDVAPAVDVRELRRRGDAGQGDGGEGVGGLVDGHGGALPAGPAAQSGASFALSVRRYGRPAWGRRRAPTQRSLARSLRHRSVRHHRQRDQFPRNVSTECQPGDRGNSLRVIWLCRYRHRTASRLNFASLARHCLPVTHMRSHAAAGEY
jgi:hypothetical protein